MAAHVGGTIPINNKGNHIKALRISHSRLPVIEGRAPGKGGHVSDEGGMHQAEQGRTLVGQAFQIIEQIVEATRIGNPADQNHAARLRVNGERAVTGASQACATLTEQRLDALGIVGIEWIEQFNAAAHAVALHFQARVGVVDPAVQRGQRTLSTPLPEDRLKITEIHR